MGDDEAAEVVEELGGEAVGAIEAGGRKRSVRCEEKEKEKGELTWRT